MLTFTGPDYSQCVKDGYKPRPAYASANPYEPGYISDTPEAPQPTFDAYPPKYGAETSPVTKPDYYYSTPGYDGGDYGKGGRPTPTGDSPAAKTTDEATGPAGNATVVLRPSGTSTGTGGSDSSLNAVGNFSTSAGADGFTPIVGGPEIHPRLPIDTLRIQHPDVWNMFLLAFASLQAEPEAQDTSYYQVAGIHGQPLIGWQHPEHTAQLPYCAHRSIIFATWHRPYLVLLEQLLVKHAQKEAAKFTGASRTKYQAAAKRVRLPYWDWAAVPGLPAVVSERNIDVVKPVGGAVTIRNPLYSYRFQRADYRARYFSGDYEGLAETVRWPGTSAALEGTFTSRSEKAYQLFNIRSFGQFSTVRFQIDGTPISQNSVESIHDDIHGAFAGSDDPAHMGSIGVSAFDPVFWMHHCNVDRFMALYQAQRPDSAAIDGSLDADSYTIGFPGGVTEDINTPLFPFRDTNKRDLTSRDVASAKSIYSFGYSYPEMPAEYAKRPDADLADYTKKAVDALYAPNSNTTAGSDEGRSFKPAPESGASLRTEWLATLVFDESQLDNTFSVYLYLGASSTTPLNPKTVIGGCTSFSTGAQRANTTISGTVPLTAALIEAKVSLDPKAVVPYLQANLRWKVMRAGKEVAVSELSSLDVGVSAASVKYFSEEGRLPEYGRWNTYYAVTERKSGGMKVKDGALLESKDVAANATLVAPAPPPGGNNGTVTV
ncbi:hypothetical protein EDC01DRAFT_634702 [Geopyxis carbonaria]|nr:hypothetical protein EDC01DRAFT_634702 [Geopyxis carbonaria]